MRTRVGQAGSSSSRVPHLGVTHGEGLLLHVTPTRPHLPILRYSRFRTLRSTWLKAVGVVAGHIDEGFTETTHEGAKKVASYASQRGPVETAKKGDDRSRRPWKCPPTPDRG